MNWDDIKLLLLVSRNPILTDASPIIGQDATTISRRLKRLEDQLGLTLFERTRRGHILTPEAQEIVRKAEQMEQSVIDLAAFAKAETSIAGRVRLAVTEGFGTYFIAPEMNQFTKQQPSVGCDLLAIPGFANVSRREADMAIVLNRPQKGRLKVRKLTEYELNLYSTQDYLDRSSEVKNVSDLSDHSLIGYMDELLYSDQLNYYQDILPGLTPNLCSPSIVAQLQMTRSGAGIAMLPRFMAIKHKELVPVLNDQVRIFRTFWLAIHENVHTLARVKAMSQFLTDIVRKKASDLLRDT